MIFFQFLKYCDLEDFYVQNYVHYRLETEQPIITDRLSKYTSFWHSLGTPECVLSIVDKGFKIPFFENPLGCFFKITKVH